MSIRFCGEFWWLRTLNVFKQNYVLLWGAQEIGNNHGVAQLVEHEIVSQEAVVENVRVHFKAI